MIRKPSRYAYCNARRSTGAISFLILPELLGPLKRVSGKTEFGHADAMLIEIVENFRKLSRREADRRIDSMKRKWPKLDPRYRNPADRIEAILGNAMLQYWIETREKADAR